VAEAHLSRAGALAAPVAVGTQEESAARLGITGAEAEAVPETEVVMGPLPGQAELAARARTLTSLCSAT